MQAPLEPKLEIQLFGPFMVRWVDGEELRLAGQKQRALLALLASSPDMVRTRAWLVATLWGNVDDHLGRASLRQALSAMRNSLGGRFDLVFDVQQDRIGFRAGGVVIHEDPSRGDFLEGMDLGEEGFEDWLRTSRQAAAGRMVSGVVSESLRPRIAVLPLLSAQPEAAQLGDAVAQELIRALARSQLIDMISHLSSRTLDPTVVELAQLKTALGADYIVTGRVLEAGGRLAVDIDFHDTYAGTLVWGDRFVANAADFLHGDAALVHEIAAEVVGAVLVNSIELGAIRPLPSVTTHGLMMSAIGLMYQMSTANFARAKEQVDEVIRRAPRHSIPRAWSAQWHLLKVFQGWSENPAQENALAVDAVQRALDLNPQCAFSLAMDGNVKTVLQGDFDAARKSFEASLAVNNSSAIACQFKALLHSFLGEGRTAVALSERAKLLSPCDPRVHFFEGLSATAYLVAGDYAKAIELAEASLLTSPRHVSAMRAKLAGLQLMGQPAAAKAVARELLTLDPAFTVEGYLTRHPAGKTRVGQEWGRVFEAAGIPLH